MCALWICSSDAVSPYLPNEREANGVLNGSCPTGHKDGFLFISTADAKEKACVNCWDFIGNRLTQDKKRLCPSKV